MRNTARAKGHLTWTHMKLILANLNNVLAFKHVPKLVFVRVNVKRRVERVYFFDDGESSASRIGRGPVRGPRSTSAIRRAAPASADADIWRKARSPRTTGSNVVNCTATTTSFAWPNQPPSLEESSQGLETDGAIQRTHWQQSRQRAEERAHPTYPLK